jgi:Dual specificity phosphatase, catalytic domain
MRDPRHGLVGPAMRPGGRPGGTLIVPGLVVGEYPTPEDAAWLVETWGTTAVVCLQDDADLAGKRLRLGDLERAYGRRGLAFHRRPVTDGDPASLEARLDALLALLARLIGGGGSVYLHCNAGINRAPTVAIGYLHVHGGLSLVAARDLVKARRPCVPYMRMLEAHFGTA